MIKDMSDACKGSTICHEMEVKFSSDGGDTLETPQSVIDKWIAGIVEFPAQERK